MGEPTMAAAQKGLFKRETKGQSTTPVTVAVERGRIQFFAQVLGEVDPMYIDVEAARRAGHPDTAAPPSFFMVLEALADDRRRQMRVPSALELIGCDLRYLLHGDERYQYDGLIYAGDEVAMSTRIVDFYEKKGGAMEFAVLESEITHPDRGTLVRATRTLLHRLG